MKGMAILWTKGGMSMADSKGYQFFQNRQCEYFPCHEVEKEEDFEEAARLRDLIAELSRKEGKNA